jgi:hypothetical protein
MNERIRVGHLSTVVEVSVFEVSRLSSVEVSDACRRGDGHDGLSGAHAATVDVRRQRGTFCH